MLRWMGARSSGRILELARRAMIYMALSPGLAVLVRVDLSADTGYRPSGFLTMQPEAVGVIGRNVHFRY
jgi:hypothetical protein